MGIVVAIPVLSTGNFRPRVPPAGTVALGAPPAVAWWHSVGPPQRWPWSLRAARTQPDSPDVAVGRAPTPPAPHWRSGEYGTGRPPAAPRVLPVARPLHTLPRSRAR